MASGGIRTSVLDHIDTIAQYTGTDIFLLHPKAVDTEVSGSYLGGGSENGLDQRFRVAIYGDMESAEHAKTRVLILIDQIVRFYVVFGTNKGMLT